MFNKQRFFSYGKENLCHDQTNLVRDRKEEFET